MSKESDIRLAQIQHRVAVDAGQEKPSIKDLMAAFCAMHGNAWAEPTTKPVTFVSPPRGLGS